MMNILQQVIDLFLHLDVHLAALIAQFGVLTHIILFVVIFCETGLVFMPFLPGDSLLFAAGAFAARGSLNPWMLTGLLMAAAILGDSCNYWLGKTLGRRVFRQHSRILTMEHLTATEEFYRRHGGKAVILARFLPMFRTMAPFVAGIAKMPYGTFSFYNIAGGALWVLMFLWGGYFFGTIPFVEKNFTPVILAIIALSLAPAVTHAVIHAFRKRCLYRE